MGQCWFSKAMAVLLAASLFSGCATRKMDFSSAPMGATVVVGGKQGTTPCTLRVPEGAASASFRLPSGEEKILPLPRLDNLLDDSAQTSGMVVGVIFKVTGAVLVVAGLLVSVVAADDCGEDWGFHDANDCDDDSDIVLIGLGGILAGVGLYGLGEWIEPEYEHPFLYADFSLPGEELYEDKGYGARRVKSVAP